MPNLADLSKRLLVGRALRSAQLSETLLPKRIALPVFASDALSSVAYATQEILLVLSLAGTALLHLTWYAAAAVVVVMLTVVASYRQNVHAYPSGGGDYEIANTNLGPGVGLVVASALLVDYVLTVAVSTSAGVANLASAYEVLAGHEVGLTLGIVALIVLMNLRGVRESGTAFAIPTYAFMLGILGMIAWGLIRILLGHDMVAASARYEIRPESGYTSLTTLGILFLGLRAFASGCTALTGVEAISNGVPAFRKPKSKNAATTLALMGGIAVTMFTGVTFLAIHTRVHIAEHTEDLVGFTGEYQKTVIAQIGETVFGTGSLGFYYVQFVTAIILLLAGYMPRQLHNRGDRLVFSNGILLLAAFAGLLIWAFDANPSRLIQLYIVGVFVSFTLSQIGMVRHWTRLLKTETDPKARRKMSRSRLINGFGACLTGTVLVVVLVTKFVYGAWIAIAAMAVLWVTMRGIKRHYDRVANELRVAEGAAEATTLPSRVHAIVLVSKIHKPTLRALAFARAARPSVLEAVTVNVDPEDTKALQEEWDRRELPVPLKVLDSPYREITQPIVNYVRSIRRNSPRDVVAVFIPEYVVGHWWEHLLHNQSALRIKGRLLFEPGVMVTSVPYQLASSAKLEQKADRAERFAPGAIRRGEPARPSGAEEIVSR
ncbi:APC family permease [Carbonactinospora thermoautotrophica]|uniref:APC family permease n=1 Tax=Carbonactinospora thermoautotrophica TaxID=1469144 RepID=UPI003DA8C5DD